MPKYPHRISEAYGLQQAIIDSQAKLIKLLNGDLTLLKSENAYLQEMLDEGQDRVRVLEAEAIELTSMLETALDDAEKDLCKTTKSADLFFEQPVTFEPDPNSPGQRRPTALPGYIYVCKGKLISGDKHWAAGRWKLVPETSVGLPVSAYRHVITSSDSAIEKLTDALVTKSSSNG